MKPRTRSQHPLSLRPSSPRRLLARALPRRIPLQTRLALIYGVMFLVAGVVLLSLTYVLFNQQIGPSGAVALKIDPASGGPTPAQSAGPGADFVLPEETYELPRPDPDEGTDADEDTDEGTRKQMIIGRAEADKWMKANQVRLHDAATDSLITQGTIALAVVGGVATAFGWLVAGRVLAPLRQVTDTARRIAQAPAADRGLHERIALNGPDDEVKDLADTFDTMVERLDRSFDGQRRFVANASHELRTPLTLGRALVEVAMHRKSASEDVKQLGENLLEINSRHERLITGLLLLAGSENAITERSPVDLADVIEHVVAQTATDAERAGVTVHEQAREAPTSGDALLLERLVHNLVENGIRHNIGEDGGGWVRVTSRVRPDGDAEVEVSNTGPVVPPYEVPALFEPFRRLGADRLVTGKGAGLGLSIVRSVARAHDGDVTAAPREGGGLTVTVVLPPGPERSEF